MKTSGDLQSDLAEIFDLINSFLYDSDSDFQSMGWKRVGGYSRSIEKMKLKVKIWFCRSWVAF